MENEGYETGWITCLTRWRPPHAWPLSTANRYQSCLQTDDFEAHQIQLKNQPLGAPDFAFPQQTGRPQQRGASETDGILVEEIQP